MSNTAYPLGMQALLAAGINFTSDTISAALVPSTYTYSAAHQYASSLGTIIGTAQDLVDKVITGGVLDADDLNFGALAPGNTIKALALFKNTGNLSTSPLLFYFDAVTGLPAATNGGVITVPWGDDVKKIARITTPAYPLGAEKMLSGAINFSSDTIKVRLLPASYVYDAGHEFLDDLPAGIGTDQTLTSKSITNGVFDAADAAFGALASGSSIGSILLYKSTGTDSTSPLLIRFSDTVGLPYDTNGATYTQQWNNGTSKIFRLAA